MDGPRLPKVVVVSSTEEKGKLRLKTEPLACTTDSWKSSVRVCRSASVAPGSVASGSRTVLVIRVPRWPKG